MSKSVNKVILLGNLGKDAETKFTQSGVACTKFTVATERSWKDKGSDEWKKETDWHNVILWRAEKLANYLLKGTKVYVEGRLSHRKYEDNEGQTKYFTEIVAEDVALCGGGNGNSEGGERRSSSGSGGQRQQQQKSGDFDEQYGITDDDVPF